MNGDEDVGDRIRTIQIKESKISREGGDVYDYEYEERTDEAEGR